MMMTVYSAACVCLIIISAPDPSVCVMRAPGGACQSLARWAHATPAPLPVALDAHAHARTPPAFTHDDEINNRFAIWHGDISTLDADAITNTTDETLMEYNAISERIMHAAGPDLKEEIITRAHECRTGEVVVTPGFSLRSRYVIHTVCPKYVANYHTAAEISLHNCYKNALHAAGELGARSLALCLVHAPRRAFPPDLATHIALRTVRRYLEQHARPQLVVLASGCAAGAALATALAPLYFPRGAREAAAARAEPGGPAGEPAHPDRRIRIIHNPHSHNSDSAEDDTSLYDEDAAVEAAAAFARACAPDTQRLLAPARASAPLRHLVEDHDQ